MQFCHFCCCIESDDTVNVLVYLLSFLAACVNVEVSLVVLFADILKEVYVAVSYNCILLNIFANLISLAVFSDVECVFALFAVVVCTESYSVEVLVVTIVINAYILNLAAVYI